MLRHVEPNVQIVARQPRRQIGKRERRREECQEQDRQRAPAERANPAAGLVRIQSVERSFISNPACLKMLSVNFQELRSRSLTCTQSEHGDGRGRRGDLLIE